ncbi:MAG: histone deacetylase [Candidatus Bathyarchaeia archaeon]|nr:histone deacetylase [Candidatus Bathyarchaeota archaeon]
MGTAIIYTPRYLDHRTGGRHPERPRRLTAIINGILESRLIETGCIRLIEPRPASMEDLESIHKAEHINRVRSICSAGGGLLDEETEVSAESFDVAIMAAGGAIEAVERVISGEFSNAFALIRPPGHHAGPDYSEGFCIFNNVAIAARYLQRKHGLERILILDIDTHHGNGTQDIFYDTSSVLYMSIHEDPREFPGTGFIWEVGAGEGRGYTVNIPLPYGSGDPAYWRAMKTVVLPIAEQYRPQFILVSAGFDGYYRDGIGNLALSAQIYPKIFGVIHDLAHKVCGGRLVAVLEGGYNTWLLRRAAAACIARMAGMAIKIMDRRPPINLAAQKGAEKIIEAVKRVQSRYWSI